MKILILMFLLCCPVLVFSQSGLSDSALKQCQEVLPKLQLRGFKLGMTSADVKKKYPEFKVPKADMTGLSKTESFHIVSKSSAIRKVKSEIIDEGKYAEFKGLMAVSLDFVDYKLARFHLFYEGNGEWNNTDDFANSIAKKLNLPKEWDYVQKGKLRLGKLQCGDYGIVVSTDKNSYGVLEPFLSVANTKLLDLAAERAEDVAKDININMEEIKQKKKQKFKP